MDDAGRGLTWDLHVHGAPSASPRWGNDLDLVEAAARWGVQGFVLKSHHEATASRAVIANAFARRIGARVRVVGSATLNPWLSREQLERAVQLGASVIWWPTSDNNGNPAGLARPALHYAGLELAVRAGCIVATGHLRLAEALALVAEARSLGLDVVATHPFNPDVGVGPAGARQLAAAGAVVEVDAYSIRLLSGQLSALVRDISGIHTDNGRVILTSDGGQAATGDPFAFGAAAREYLREAGLRDVERLVRQASALMNRDDERMEGFSTARTGAKPLATFGRGVEE